jgi:hypothetical protein
VFELNKVFYVYLLIRGTLVIKLLPCKVSSCDSIVKVIVETSMYDGVICRVYLNYI